MALAPHGSVQGSAVTTPLACQNRQRAPSLFSGADNSPTQSDPKDAGVIARLVAEGRFQTWRQREGVWAERQTLAVVRRQPRQAVTPWPNRVAGWLVLSCPEFPPVFTRWSGQAALWVLDHAPWPAEVQTQGVDALAAGRRGATHHRVGRQRAQRLWAAAQTSVGVPGGVPGARYPLHGCLAAWRPAGAALAATERAQARCRAAIPAAAWRQTIPGWGPVVTGTVLGELGAWARCHDPREALKMSGLHWAHARAGYHHGRTPIRKRGRPGARLALYQAAPAAVAHDPAWRHRAENPWAPQAARVAVAAKLWRVAWAWARHGMPDEAAGCSRRVRSPRRGPGPVESGAREAPPLQKGRPTRA